MATIAMRRVRPGEVPRDGGTAIQEDAGRPVFRGNGPDDYVCVECGNMLAAAMHPDYMTVKVRVRCGRCGTVNVAVTDEAGVSSGPRSSIPTGRRGDPMSEGDERGARKPSEQRGGTTPDEAEAREKGQWAETSAEGIVPADLGGSDAPREMLADDPELESAVLGRTTGSDEPATEGGIDASAGDEADATADGGPEVPEGVEPDLRDAASGPPQTDRESAG